MGEVAEKLFSLLLRGESSGESSLKGVSKKNLMVLPLYIREKERYDESVVEIYIYFFFLVDVFND